jgi:hypothetical protein
LASSYYKHRKEAIELAIERNKLLQQATEAYLSGNKATAKAFSLQAHELNKELDLLNNTAANKIYTERNQQDGVVDLHGLHEDEW